MNRMRGMPTVGRVSGQSFRPWTEANLFQPLALKRQRVNS
jgi:hypothetical protein